MVCLSDLPIPAPRPTPSRPATSAARPSRPLSDVQAIEAIYQRLMTDHDNWGADTLQAISDVITLTGRAIVDVEAIEAEMLESSTGWPIARVQADQVTGYFHQASDGGIVVDLYTRDEDSADQLRILIDGRPVYGGPLPEAAAAPRRPQPR